MLVRTTTVVWLECSFHFLIVVLIIIIFLRAYGGAPARNHHSVWAAKLLIFFESAKNCTVFRAPSVVFFSPGGRRGLPIRRPFTANQYRPHTDSATLLQHETDVTAAAVSVYGDRRTGITTAATHACDGRRTPTPNPERRRQFAAEAPAFAPVCTTNLQSDPRAAKHLGQPCVFSAKM